MNKVLEILQDSKIIDGESMSPSEIFEDDDLGMEADEELS